MSLNRSIFRVPPFFSSWLSVGLYSHKALTQTAVRSFRTVLQGPVSSSSVAFPTRTEHNASLQTSLFPHTSFLPSTIFVRCKMTKAKKKRVLKRITAQRILDSGRTLPPKRHPPTNIPKTTPVLNSVSRDIQLSKAQEFDKTSAVQLKARMEQIQNTPSARFHFDEDPTLMEKASSKVRRLLSLSNGSLSEVVKAQKKKGMTLFQLREGDTGSSAVQVIALTTRIQQMQRHMALHRKDTSGKRGMEALFVRRRKVLDYMERKDFDSYRKVVKTLGLIR